MSATTTAVTLAVATVAFILWPGAWKSAVAALAFSCGINTAIALMGGRP